MCSDLSAVRWARAVWLPCHQLHHALNVRSGRFSDADVDLRPNVEDRAAQILLVQGRDTDRPQRRKELHHDAPQKNKSPLVAQRLCRQAAELAKPCRADNAHGVPSAPVRGSWPKSRFNSVRETFPTVVRGRLSMKKTWRGFLKPARCARQCSSTSFSVTIEPGV